MKKLLCLAAVACFLTACGSTDEKTMSCKLEQKQSGMNITTTVDFDYVGSSVKTQNQTSEIVFSDDSSYDAMVPSLKAMDQTSTTKDMDGVKYSLNFDKGNKTVTETFNIDITKIASKDYANITGQAESAVKGMKIDVDKSKENMEKSGFTCADK